MSLPTKKQQQVQPKVVEESFFEESTPSVVDESFFVDEKKNPVGNGSKNGTSNTSQSQSLSPFPSTGSSFVDKAVNPLLSPTTTVIPVAKPLPSTPQQKEAIAEVFKNPYDMYGHPTIKLENDAEISIDPKTIPISPSPVISNPKLYANLLEQRIKNNTTTEQDRQVIAKNLNPISKFSLEDEGILDEVSKANGIDVSAISTALVPDVISYVFPSLKGKTLGDITGSPEAKFAQVKYLKDKVQSEIDAEQAKLDRGTVPDAGEAGDSKLLEQKKKQLEQIDILNKKVAYQLTKVSSEGVNANIRTDESGSNLNRFLNNAATYSIIGAATKGGKISEDATTKIEALPPSFMTGVDYLQYVEPVKYERLTSSLAKGEPISESEKAQVTAIGLDIEDRKLKDAYTKQEINQDEYAARLDDIKGKRYTNIVDNKETLRALLSNGIAELADADNVANERGKTAESLAAGRVATSIFGHRWNYSDAEIESYGKAYAQANGIDVTDSRVKDAIKYLQDNEGAMIMQNSIAKSGFARDFAKGLAQPIRGINSSISDLGKSSAEVYAEGQSQGNVNVSEQRLKRIDNSWEGTVASVMEGTGQFVTQAGIAALTSSAIGGAARGLLGARAATVAAADLKLGATAIDEASVAAESIGNNINLGSKSISEGVGNFINGNRDAISTYITSYAQSYDGNLKTAQTYTEDEGKARAVAMGMSFLEGGTEQFLSPLDVARGIGRNLFKSGAGMRGILAVINDAAIVDKRAVISNVIKNIIRGGLETGKIVATEIGEEEVTQLADYGANAILNPNSQSFQNRDIANEIVNTANQTGLSMIIPALFSGAGAVNANSFSKGTLVIAAQNRQHLLDDMNKMLFNGEMTQDEFNEKAAIINTAEKANTNLPKKADGADLNSAEKADYIYSRTAEAVLEKRLKVSDDEADKTIINKKIKEQQLFRTGILESTTSINEDNTATSAIIQSLPTDVSQPQTGGNQSAVQQNISGTGQGNATTPNAVLSNLYTKLDNLHQQFLNNGKTDSEATNLALESISEQERTQLRDSYSQNVNKTISTENQNQKELIVSDVNNRAKETEAKIKRKDLFQDGGSFSNILGESGVNSVPTSHEVINNIEFVQFSNPNTGIVDVIMSGKADHDFVGYYRIYKNGVATDQWSSKFENQSRNKADFKTMISGVQSMLPAGHEYTEKTSISTDGLRVWGQQLDKGYNLQYDKNGKLITNSVAINGDAIINDLGIPVDAGNFNNISVKDKKSFDNVKTALLPYLEKFGLNESNIRNIDGKVEIDLPVLKKGTQQNIETSDNNNINRTSLIQDAATLVESGVVKGFTAPILKDAAANNITEFEQHLSEIADQANDPDSVKGTIRTYGQELVDIATALFPKNNFNETKLQETTQPISEASNPVTGNASQVDNTTAAANVTSEATVNANQGENVNQANQEVTAATNSITELEKIPFEERTDKQHSDFVKRKFVQEFTKKGVPKEQVDAAVALMDARAKASGQGNSWYRQIENVSNGDFKDNSKSVLFQVLDDINIFESNDPHAAKNFISKVFNTVENEVDAKAAYKKLAIKYHPDKNPSVSATSIFQHLNNVYESYTKRGSKGTGNYNDFGESQRSQKSDFDRYQQDLFRKRKEEQEKRAFVGVFAELQARQNKERSDLRAIQEGRKKDFDANEASISKVFDDYIENYKKKPATVEGMNERRKVTLEYENLAQERRRLFNLEITKEDEAINEKHKQELNDYSNRARKFQIEGGSKKGALETLANGRKIIHALESPDFSTTVHELAHVFEDEVSASDRKVIQEWAGTKEWNTKTSETFARGFERYLRDGNAPTEALKSIFAKAKEWLQSIYKSLTGSAIAKKITPEVKEVFDNLFKANTGVNNEDNQPLTKENFTEKVLSMTENMVDSTFDWRLSIPSMSQEQRQKAVNDIRNGVDSIAARKLQDVINDWYEKGTIEVNRGRGNNAENQVYDLNEWFGENITEEELNEASKIDDESTQIINDEGITAENIDSLKNLFNGFPYTETDFTNVKDYLNRQSESNAQTENNSTVIEEPAVADLAKPITFADRIRKGKIADDITFVGIPFAKEVWNAGVEAVALAIEGGATAVDAIKKGIEEIKKSDWYKNLTDEQKQKAEIRFTSEHDYLSDTPKSLADKIKADEILWNDATEGRDQDFIDKLNKELTGSKKFNFDEDGFKSNVQRQKDYGSTQAEVIEGFETIKKLTKRQRELIDEVFGASSENDKQAAELLKAFQDLARGEKPKSVLKKLAASDVDYLVKALSDHLSYTAVSNVQLEALADYIVDSIDINKSETYLNAMINNASQDVKQLLRAKLIVALTDAGNTELATKLVRDMADEATRTGRQTQSLGRAYEILGAKGSPAMRSEFARVYAEKVNAAAAQKTQHLSDVISGKDVEIGALNDRIHNAALNKKSTIDKIKDVISNLCKIRTK